MTQEELAGNAGLSIPTVRLLERTHGNLTSWNVVLGVSHSKSPGETSRRERRSGGALRRYAAAAASPSAASPNWSV